MPKSRGRGGRRKPYRSPRPHTVGGNVSTDDNGKWNLVKDIEDEAFRNKGIRDYRTPRSAMVAASLMFGHRFPEGSVNDTNPGPNGEAWTNAWYTYKENKDKGWRYCEGVVKLADAGLMTSAWVIDGYGHVLECSAGVEADWYQGFVMNEENEMMNTADSPWDEGYDRPLVAQRSAAEILDGERQLEAVSRLHGEAWLGSMMETAVAAFRQAYGASYIKALVSVMPEIVDQEATDKFPKGPDLRQDAEAFEEVEDLGPGNPDENTQR